MADSSAFCKAIKGYHHIALTVSDEAWDKVIAFYGDLGFKLKYLFHHPSGSGQRMAFLESERAGFLELFAKGTGSVPDDFDLMHTAGRYLHMCFEVDRPEDVDAVYELLMSLGAKDRISPCDIKQDGTREVETRAAFVYGLEKEIIEIIYSKIK